MKPAEREALQQKYTEDYLRTRIPLEAWCIENGYVYNSVRRFIKKPKADAHKSEVIADQNAQKAVRKTAQKKTAQNAQNQKAKHPKASGEQESISAIEKLPTITRRDDIDLTFDPSEYGLTQKEAYFVFYFLKTDSRVEAYRLAGYEGEGNTAYVGASRLYRKDKVARAIRELGERFRKKFNADVDLLVDQLMAIIAADPNEIVQYRRVNCRFCWGENHLYQWRDIQEFDAAAEKAAEDGNPEPEYGGVGFVDSLDPNPDCPKCTGEGRGRVHINDTRDLESKAHKLYAGIKQGRFGIEVLTEDKKSARILLAQLITKFDLNNNSDNVPKGLNDFYADIGKAYPESGSAPVLDNPSEE